MNKGGESSIYLVCRICLNYLRNDPAYDLFLVPGLAKKLCVCTSLSVEQHDGFPRCLCSTCHTRLNDLHEFQKLCVDSVQKFQEMVSNNYFAAVDDVDKMVVVNDAEAAEEMEDDHLSFDPLLNTKIEIVETDVLKMLDNVDEEDEESEKELSSDGDFENDDDPEFEVNSSDSNDDLPLSRLKTITRASNAKNNLVVKDKDNDEDKNKDSSDFEWEMNDDFDKEEPNPKSRRKRATIQKAKQDDSIDCHICNENFKDTKLYEEHMKHHNDLLPFQCTVETCKKGFSTSGGLRSHVEHAHSEFSEVHACSVEGCGMTFPRSISLTNHLKRVHKIYITSRTKDHPCTVCEKVFRCTSALKKHMYKHTGEEKPISCNICNKRFHINSELKDHLLRHAGVKTHICPYCGVGRTTRQEWNKHILTHTREKQFKCDQCKYSTHNKQALANHVKVVHMKIKNYICQYCGKAFGKSYARYVHERSHTGENVCECKICGKILLFEKSLTRHLKTHEKREQSASAKTAKRRAAVNAKQKQNMNGDVTDTEIAKPIATEQPKQRIGVKLKQVDISELAGTVVNPIPTVSVASQSPQVDFNLKEGQCLCPECGRVFNNMGNMKLHYKIIHLKVKDFACRFCPKRFSKSQILRNHEYIHTGEKPFECTICGKYFRQMGVMMTHRRKVHENPKPPKERKPKYVSKEKRPRMKLNKKPPKILDEYQDPAAEREAASAALLAQQKEEYEAKQRAEEEARKIQEAACAQLHMLQKEQLISKLPSESFQVKKPATGISVADLKED